MCLIPESERQFHNGFKQVFRLCITGGSNVTNNTQSYLFCKNKNNSRTIYMTLLNSYKVLDIKPESKTDK